MSAELQQRARWLSYFTVGYNVIEGVLAVGLGFLTGSIALVGFGFDSFIESLSGSIMIWRFGIKGRTEEEEEAAEQRAVKLVGATFFLLGIYVLYESIKDLFNREAPEPSLFGLIIAVLSLVIMPTLSYLKYQTGKQLGSKSLMADSKQTLICVLMSAALLIGLGANYFYGIWWLDPIAGLFFVFMLFKEGYETLKEGELD